MVRPQKKISEKKEKISLPASRFLANFGIKRGYQLPLMKNGTSAEID